MTAAAAPDANAHHHYRPAGDVHVRDFDGELVVLDLAKGDYFGLNEVGAKLWSGLVAGQSPAEVADALFADYDVTRERLLADLVALTGELLARGLIEPTAATAAP